jgi:hypothetical protein
MHTVPSHRRLLILALLCAAGSGVPPSFADGHGRAPAEQAAPMPKPEPGNKFATDEVLRKGMDAVAAILAPRLDDVRAARLQGAAYTEMAGQVETRLAEIARNCRLDPKADQAFRHILMDMNHAVNLMRARKGDLQRAGALALWQSLRNYGKYFDHPGWTPPRLATAE